MAAELTAEPAMSDTAMPAETTGRTQADKEPEEAQQLLTGSHRQLADIINFLPCATFAIDGKGRVIAWNGAMEKITGIRALAMLGKGNFEYSLPFYGERKPMLVDLVLDRHGPLEAPCAGTHNNRARLVAEARMPALGGKRLFAAASALCDSKGNVAGAIESVCDISDRRHAAEALSEAEGIYRNHFENTMEGTYRSTFEGRLVSVNSAFACILGYDSPRDAVETITDIPHQLYVDPRRRAEILQQVKNRRSSQGFETQLFRKDGSIAWVKLNMHVVCDNRGDDRFLEGTIRDISYRKAWESKLAHAQKMEAIGTLATGIAHDFNNILTGIMGYTELIANKIGDKQLIGYTEQVLKSCNRAKNLISQVLTFSRRSESDIKTIDIAQLISEFVKLIRATLPSTIEIFMEFSSEPCIISGDPTKLYQMLMNLCTNAAHAMRSSGGILELKLRHITIDSKPTSIYTNIPHGKYIELCVHDTGTGISPLIVDRIFNPFFTTKDEKNGTGLGLSIVYDIVKDCKGTITVESKPGIGSSFFILFPASTDKMPVEQEPLETSFIGSERILLVDDETAIVATARAMLRDLGYQVVATRKSTKALEIFRNRSREFDLIVTDMTMPGLTGMELAGEALKIRPDIPIVLCTGFSELVTEEESKRLGISEFITKPFTRVELSKAIRKASASKTYGRTT